jgi:uncharacterized protein
MMICTPVQARRLAVLNQRLAGPRPTQIMDVARQLGCLQLDPLSVVARSHQLVLWSRLGGYDLATLDRLLWEERQLFEYWAHCASIVLTEDFPLHQAMMRRYPTNDRISQWTRQNQPLQRYILGQIRRHGPRLSRDLEEAGFEPTQWVSTGWTSGRNISRMLDYLWLSGKIMVSGRQGIQKVWDLSARCLPSWAPREKLSRREVVRRAAQRALRALGVATPRQIEQHFLRGRYPNLAQVLPELEETGEIQRIEIREAGQAWPGDWYIHAADIPQLGEVNNGAWAPRTTLLSPFDNLICDRQRTEQLFNFDFRVEIYTPQAKRKYGYYVLPILHGDQLIGRVDPVMDRSQAQLKVNAVHAEPGAPQTRKAARAVAHAVEELGAFLGAHKIVYNKAKVPDAWKRDLLS